MNICAPAGLWRAAATVCCLATLAASAATTTKTESNQPYTVSDTDLLQRNVSAVDTNGAVLYFEGGIAGVPAYLTDGTTGPGNREMAFNLAGGPITYYLDTTTSPSGYTITGLDSYSGWQDGGRVDQNYVVSFRRLGSSTFESAITNSYASGMKETRISVSDIGLNNVDAIKITFLAQENNGVGYKEFDLFGMATTTNFSLTGISGSTAYPVSSNDLLQSASVVSNSTFAYYAEGGFTNALIPALADGSFGSPNRWLGTCGITGGALTYTLNTTNNPSGYTINSLDSFTGWNDNGRDNQNFLVSFRKVGSTSFGDTFPVCYTGSVMLTHVNVTNLSLAHVDAVRFTFLAQENGGVGYKELDLLGAPPLYTEVTSLDSGSKVIASNDTASVFVTDGSGNRSPITLGTASTAIDSLVQGTTTGLTVIDPAGQTLALNGLFLRPDAGILAITNGTLLGLQSPLVVGNASSNAVVLGAAIANRAPAGFLLKTGPGTLTLASTNSSPGGTEVSGGTLRLVSGASLGSGYVNVHDGTLQLDGGLVNPATSNSMRLCFINATLNQTAGSLSYGGYLQAQNTALNLSGGSSYLVADALLGWGGTNTTATIGGTHSADWRTTRFSSGTVSLTLQSGGKLYTDRIYSSVGATGSVYFDGGTLAVSSQNPSLYSSDWLGVASGSLSLLVRDGGAVIDTANGGVTIRRPFLRDGASAGGLTKTGANTLTLLLTNSAATVCTYAGDTAVLGGTLKLWPGSSPLPPNTRLSVADGAFLDLNGATQAVGEASGAGRIVNTSTTNAVLTVGGDNASTNFSGIIDGAVSLVKTGAGTWTLSGANAFSNGVRISGGTLRLAPLPVAIVNAGFELPALSTNNTGAGFQYQTSDGLSGGWIMSGNTGNNTGSGVAYSGYPTNAPWSFSAPQGVQIGYLQGGSYMYQTVTVQRAGTYRLAFSAANRPRYQADNVFLYIDNGLAASWTNAVFASNGIFANFATNVDLSTGPHELRFVGTIATPGGDTTTTLDDLHLFSAGNTAWSNLPTGAVVTVDAGATLDLNGTTAALSALSGSGTVSNGTVAVQGVIAPGGTNVLGTLTLAASTSLSGTLLVDVAADGTCDRLQVQGALDLSGLRLQIQDLDKLQSSEPYLIATCAPGGLSGRFVATTLGTKRVVSYDAARGRVSLIRAGLLITLI